MTPDGYERRRARGARGLAVTSAADWLEGVLAAGETLHGWASGQDGAEAVAGRGTVYTVPAPLPGPDGHPRWAVRHYRRGGAVAGPLLGDRYLRAGPTRPEREAAASLAARARGVPTPAVVAGAWYPAGAFYRADLVTELVPDTVSLAHLLFERARDDGARAALRAAGALVRACGARGLAHPDLNAANVLLRMGGDEVEAFVVDLDRAAVREVPDSSTGKEMIARLTRSLRKLGSASGRPLDEGEVSALWAGFEGRA